MKRLILVLALVASGACDRSDRDMDTKTYELSRLNMDEAMSLLTPYISERGRLSGKNRLITVRERPERLKQIDGLLQKYDGIGETVDVIMDVQVIDADGFTARDSAIADVEQTLRQTFKYRGYKLRGSARIQAREDSNFRQQVETFTIQGRVFRAQRNGTEQRLPIEVMLRTREVELMSTVTATIGKPVVLGQSTDGGAVILVIRTSLAAS